MATEDELLAKLERWLASRPAPPNIFEVIETGDGELFAAFVLKGFRAAAREAVVDRLQGEAAQMYRGEPSNSTGAVFRILDGLSDAWMLAAPERLALLGLRDSGDLKAARAVPIAELPIEIIERLAILLDIFQAINVLLPEPSRADAWIRTPNRAAIFAGASALVVMQSGIDGLRKVRSYLMAQLHSGP